MPNEITLSATLSALSPLAAWLEKQMLDLPVSEAWRFALDLAVCETATNIIRHGLNEAPHLHFVIAFSRSTDKVTVTFTDHGRAFPVERLATARNQLDQEMMPDLESGRGLSLILLNVTDFSVERQGHTNITSLVKYVDSCTNLSAMSDA